MARIFVDSNVFGEDWFKDIQGKLVSASKIKFAYTDHEKLVGEGERCRKLRTFYKLVRDLGKRDDVPLDECTKQIEFLTGRPEWKAEKSCDDEHVFAMTHIKPIAYVISSDHRMAKCRDCLNKHLDASYCGFRVVRDIETLEAHWHQISA